MNMNDVSKLLGDDFFDLGLFWQTLICSVCEKRLVILKSLMGMAHCEYRSGTHEIQSVWLCWLDFKGDFNGNVKPNSCMTLCIPLFSSSR